MNELHYYYRNSLSWDENFTLCRDYATRLLLVEDDESIRLSIEYPGGPYGLKYFQQLQ